VPTTPIYGLPYPSLSDPPNGAAQIQALAEAVEAELSRIDATPAAVTATDAGSVSTTSATYVTLAGDPGVAFTAPASGRVMVHVAGAFDNTLSDTFGMMAFQIRTGTTVGAGTIVVAASDNDSAGTAGTNDTSFGRSVLVSSLIAGSSYNVQILYKRFSGTGTSFFARRSVLVVPTT
jgi:hypothetical protein